MSDHTMAYNPLTVGQLFTMHRAPTAAFGKPELPEPSFYRGRATPQEVGKILRRKPFNHIFLVEKTLVKIPWRFGNFNGINQIGQWRRKVAFSQRWPTNFFKIISAKILIAEILVLRDSALGFIDAFSSRQSVTDKARDKGENSDAVAENFHGHHRACDRSVGGPAKNGGKS